MRAFHMHQTLTKQYDTIVAECLRPADQDWAPAQTALASAMLAMVITGSLPPEDKAIAVDLFRRAALAGEPVAMSMYGGLIGGQNGRRMIRNGAERGILSGATWMSNHGGEPFQTPQQREDAYWASYVVELSSVIQMSAIRARFESGPDSIPAEIRQALADDARTVRLGPAGATPVSPQITFDIQAAISEKHPLKDSAGRPITFWRVLDTAQYNPTNRGFALLLSEDPQMEAVVRSDMSASPWIIHGK